MEQRSEDLFATFLTDIQREWQLLIVRKLRAILELYDKRREVPVKKVRTLRDLPGFSRLLRTLKNSENSIVCEWSLSTASMMSATYWALGLQMLTNLLRSVNKSKADQRVLELLLADFSGLLAIEGVEGLPNFPPMPSTWPLDKLLVIEGDKLASAVVFQPFSLLSFLQCCQCLLIL